MWKWDIRQILPNYYFINHMIPDYLSTFNSVYNCYKNLSNKIMEDNITGYEKSMKKENLMQIIRKLWKHLDII